MNYNVSMKSSTETNSFRAPTCEEAGAHTGEVKAALDAMPPRGEIQDASQLLKVLGDPTRMRILSALAGRELCVCDLQVILEMSQSAVSHQLRVLRDARLVAHQRRGKMVFYSLADDHVQELLQSSLDHIRHG